jgi:hypothetical protein
MKFIRINCHYSEIIFMELKAEWAPTGARFARLSAPPEEEKAEYRAADPKRAANREQRGRTPDEGSPEHRDPEQKLEDTQGATEPGPLA